jgi:hypothetical protein
MYRSLLSLAAIFPLLFGSLAFPAETHARRCPVKMPETLLSLYRNSDTIYITRYEKSEEGETIRDDEDYYVVRTRTYFSVSTTLKGEPRKMFVLEDEAYRFKGVPEEDADGEADETDLYDDDEYEEPARLAPGDDVLLFLSRDDEGTSLRLTDYRDALKRLPADHIVSYQLRINELNVMFASGKPSDAKIVDWLIRCIQDPVTRWEGAFELLQGFQELEWENSRDEAAESETDAAEAVDGSDLAIDDETEIVIPGGADLARALTDNQKQELLNILLTRPADKGNEAGGRQGLSRGDQVLLELVKRWGARRLAVFLFDLLRADAGDRYYKSQIMRTLADILGSKKLVALAEKFGDDIYENDSEFVTAGDDEDSEYEDDPVAGEVEGEEDESDEPVVDDGDTSDVEGSNVKAATLTYGELRAAVLREYLFACEIILTTTE